MALNKQQIITALRVWVNQRPGLEFGNYGNVTSYRSELRSITKDRATALRMLRDIELRDSITAPMLLEGFRAYSGRLTITEKDGKPQLDYCTGQYWPTEYRRAVCAICAAVLWDYVREHCMPSKIVEGDRNYYPHANGSRNKQSAGDWLRTHFSREYGRGIASRWFS